jgi:hypothetical protein
VVKVENKAQFDRFEYMCTLVSTYSPPLSLISRRSGERARERETERDREGKREKERKRERERERKRERARGRER